MRKIAFIAALVALSFAGALVNVSAQGKVSPDVKKIDAYVKTVDAVRKKLKKPSLIFGDTAGTESESAKWQKFASEKALETFRSRNEVYDIAFNWLSGGKIVQSTFTLSSQSGDWAKYNDHYFRADGSLAMIESDYRTFLGDFMVVRRRFFDNKGKQIHMTEKYLDLRSKKPKKHSDGVMGDDRDEVDYYLTTAKLPFAALLKGK
ncbi:MAG: hypothetical protein IPG22_14305 [Acidobacteria bacterium]|nr:hypothetical protein [Acidobacteriota bacterium]